MPERIALKDPYAEKRIYTARVIVASLGVAALLLLLVWRYFSLQILDHDIYITASDRNRVQLQPIAPKRGLIYDSRGVLLAENMPTYSLTLVKEQVDDMAATLTLLQQLLDIDDAAVEKFENRLRRRRPYQAVPLKFKLTEQEISTIAVNRYRLAGVDVDAQLSRHYPFDSYFAHAIGYVGRISEAEQFQLDAANYSGTEHIGKLGVERFYEDILHGSVGTQNVETNARGRVLRVLERNDPVPGKDLHLFLDAEIQQVAQDALGDNRGSVVAIDTRTGGVVAMVSTPSFDANLFVNGISSKDYSALRDSLDLPLFNRSLQGQYPPGSTIKPIMALAGLHHDVVTPETVVRDPGWWKLPNDERLYRDWTWKTRRDGHGTWVAMEQAIVESCDTYFYELAFQLGIDRIHEFVTPFGLGEQTGIDTTSERSGLMPSRQWKRRFKRLPWYPGETINIGIGQGYMLATPLQLAVSTAVIARRGERFVPRLVKAIGDEPLPVPQLPAIELPEQDWSVTFKAMRNVVHSYKGTAKAIAEGAAYEMAGKTGTAQVVSIAQGEEYDAEQLKIRQRDHALFVGFAPLDDPQIAVAAILENGEKSGRAAAIVRKVFDAYILRPPVTNNQGVIDEPQ